MKRNRLVALFTILLVSIFLVGSAAAQPPVKQQPYGVIKIRNQSKEQRKICMYKEYDRVRLVPQKCFVMSHGETVMWDRGSEDYALSFYVKVFKPGLVDRPLNSVRFSEKTASITMGQDLILNSTDRARTPSAFYLSICNQRLNQEVFVAVSYETNDHFVTEGWWSVKKGKPCIYIDVSRRLNKLVKLDYGLMPRIHYYAETRGANPQSWSGGANGKALCVSNSKEFNLIHKRSETYNIPCHVNVQRKEHFRIMNSPKSHELVYRLTF
jgi:uncharacterized membrane protein